VIKADGLAAGKGVVIAETRDEAYRAAQMMLSGATHGEAGRRIVIEDCLQGEEASFICLVDGEDVLPFANSQDHKRRDEGDRGPNTGGMGAYSPAPVITPEIHERIMREVIEPTVRGMIAEGTPYRGFLYAGLMVAPDGTPRVLEFNCRFGDPEAQPILLRLKSDFVELCEAALDGRLKEQRAIWDARAALGVVLAAAGYPENARTGDEIDGLESDFGKDVKVFHAGTKLDGGRVLTSGGRVLCVTALGTTVAAAQQKAYQAAARIRWDGMFYRRDIGYRAVGRLVE
jgi:phosphoribosylamine--glycine ligase